MDNAPHAAIDYILKTREAFAQAKAQRVYLEEFRKSKKAMLMRDALLNGIEAANHQEREAYSNPEYLQLIKGLAAAIETEETLRWQLESHRLEDRKSTRLNSSHIPLSRMPSSA